MTINFANLNPGKKTTAIKIGGGVFEVTYDGALKATSATIEGQIFAQTGKIGCSSRNSSDGWTIEKNRMYSGSGTTRVEFNSNGEKKEGSDELVEPMAIWAGASSSTSAKNNTFAVSKKGELYAKTGNIGNWVMKNNTLASINNQIGMSNYLDYAFWSGAEPSAPGDTPTFLGGTYFSVNRRGQLNCGNATISGSITADWLSCSNGTIGGWTIASGTLSNDSGTTVLSAIDGIMTNVIKIENSGMELGTLGAILGSGGGGWGIGINASNSIILQAFEGAGSVALKGSVGVYLSLTDGSHFYIDQGGLSTNIPADHQKGIYARFA